MATPGDLVRSLAAVTPFSESTIAVHDRHLRTAGLRSTGGRGRSAARVGARDAAVLLVSVLAGGDIVDTADTIRRYMMTRPQGQRSTARLLRATGISELSSLPADHSFVDAVEMLIAAVATGTLAASLRPTATRARKERRASVPLIEIAAVMPGTVGEIRVAGLPDGAVVNLRYALPSPWDKGTRPSKAAIDKWEGSIAAHPQGRNFERYQRVTTPVIIHLAETISDRMEG